MFGLTPQGNVATAKLVDQYKRYAIDAQSNGQAPVSYEEWVKQQVQQVQDKAGKYF